METTLIYFSVKAMSATYILYKVWMFIFSPKVYKFWDNRKHSINSPFHSKNVILLL